MAKQQHGHDMHAPRSEIATGPRTHACNTCCFQSSGAATTVRPANRRNFSPKKMSGLFDQIFALAAVSFFFFHVEGSPTHTFIKCFPQNFDRLVLRIGGELNLHTSHKPAHRCHRERDELAF